MPNQLLNKLTGRNFEFEDALCSRYRSTKSGCRLCVDLCPVNAIRVTETSVEIEDGCIDCGVCFSACPNGAFYIQGWNDQRLSEKIREVIALKSNDPVIRFSCEHAETSAEIIFPCLGRLTEALILSAFRYGAHTVEVQRPDCSACPLKKSSPHIDRILEQAKLLCAMAKVDESRLKQLQPPLREMSGESPNISSVPPKAGSCFSTKQDKPPLSRRSFLQNLAAGTASIVTDTIPNLSAEPPTEAQLFRDKILKHPENKKRTHLIKILREFPETSALDVDPKIALIAQIEVDSKCMGCNVCETLCPTGAILRKEENGAFALDFKPFLCTNCGICEAACLPKAIQIRKKVDLALILKTQQIRLIESVKRTCKACQSSFLGANSEFCPLCSDTDRRRAWLARKWLFGGKS